MDEEPIETTETTEEDLTDVFGQLGPEAKKRGRRGRRRAMETSSQGSEGFETANKMSSQSSERFPKLKVSIDGDRLVKLLRMYVTQEKAGLHTERRHLETVINGITKKMENRRLSTGGIAQAICSIFSLQTTVFLKYVNYSYYLQYF